MELGPGVLVIVFALVVIAGLGVATRPGRTANRPRGRRPRLAVRLRRRRRRMTERVRSSWHSATTRSVGSYRSIPGWWSEHGSPDTAGSLGHDSSPGYSSGGGGSSDSGGGGGGGGD